MLINRKFFSFGLLFFFFLTISACQDKENNTPANSQPPQTEKTQNNNEKAEVKTSQTLNIEAENFEFNEKKYTVKAGEEVTLNFTSKEGSHGMDIPELDVSVKSSNTVKFTAKKPGEYPIVCNQFCGSGHGGMTATLVVKE